MLTFDLRATLNVSMTFSLVILKFNVIILIFICRLLLTMWIFLSPTLHFLLFSSFARAILIKQLHILPPQYQPTTAMSRFNTNNQLCNHMITLLLLPVFQVFQSKPHWECFPTDLSSFGMRTSLWHVQRQTTLAAGKWKETPRLRRRLFVSLAGGSQVSPPASSRAPTHQTLGCTGVSLSRGGPATRSTSQWQVNPYLCLCLHQQTEN